MDDGKIYITISDKRESNETAGSSNVGAIENNSNKQNANQSNAFKNTGEYATLRFLEGQAKQFVSYSIGNIGNFTGDYRMQRDVQNVVSLGSEAIGIGIAFATGGPVMGSIALAGSVINKGYEALSSAVSNAKQNREIAQLREISGMSVLTNGSR